MQKYKHLDSCYFFTPVACNRDKWSFWTKDNRVPERVGASIEAGVWRSQLSTLAYLTQRLSVAIQRGNAASVLGTIKMDREEEEFLV